MAKKNFVVRFLKNLGLVLGMIGAVAVICGIIIGASKYVTSVTGNDAYGTLTGLGLILLVSIAFFTWLEEELT